MVKIRYTKHLQNRIIIRKINKNLVDAILKKPENLYRDILNKTNIAIGSKMGKYYMVAFIKVKEEILAITIHPINKNQITNRLKSARWISIE